MVRPDIAAARIARAQAWLTDAAEIFERPADEFLVAIKDRDLALFFLFLAIQECIDLAAHWVADASWVPPEDAGSTFDVLAQHGGIDANAADALRKAVGLRNRIAHGYAMLDYRRVQGESREGIPALRMFLDAVARAAGL